MSFVVSFNGQFKNYVYPDIQKRGVERSRGAQIVSNDVSKSINDPESSKKQKSKHHVFNSYQQVKEQEDKYKKPVQIKELIKNSLMTIYEDQSIDEAKNIMLDKRIHHLPVLNKDGVLCGIISDRDILRQKNKSHVKEIMETEVISAYGTARVSDAAKIMLHERFSSLPIVDSNHVLEGIVTLTDILRYVVTMDEFVVNI